MVSHSPNKQLWHLVVDDVGGGGSGGGDGGDGGGDGGGGSGGGVRE